MREWEEGENIMEIIIKIEADNAAFDPVHFDDTVKGLLKNAAGELSIAAIDNKFVGMRSSLIDPNGNTCGYVEMIR